MGDLKNTSIDVVKYLDVAGLNLLWSKISDKFTRQDDLIKYLTTTKEAGGLIDIAENKFVQQSAIDNLSERIDSIVSGGGGLNIDKDTIIYNNEGKLSTNLILFDDTVNHTLCLATSQTNDEGEFDGTVISEWDYSNLYSNAIKDGMLKNVSLVVIPGDESIENSGQAEGTYLKFEFETSSGSASPIYVDVSDLIDVYKPGDNYIKIVNNDTPTISLDLVKLCDDLKTDECLGITSITTRLTNVENGFGERISSLEKTIDSLNIDGLKEKIEDIEAKMNKFESNLGSIPTTPISNDEIESLE
jgi:hypothetical protein